MALHHARDIADGIAYQCYPDIDETVAEIKIVFDGMDQQNPELIEVRKVLKNIITVRKVVKKGVHMKIYISGPMSGIPDNNRDEFSSMASLIQAKGHEPVNPHDIGMEVDTRIKNPSYLDYLKADIAVLMFCDAYVLLGRMGGQQGCQD